MQLFRALCLILLAASATQATEIVSQAQNAKRFRDSFVTSRNALRPPPAQRTWRAGEGAHVRSSASQLTLQIVMVHGLLGWGPAEVFKFPYWGQTASPNYCTQLTSLTGLPCYVATVGPISSNRERAAELYAQIRGLNTDYGASRSGTWGFSRYAWPQTSMDFSYPSNAVNLLSPKQAGYLPQWCMGNNTDVIHFVGHSLGGPTIRMLERLIRLGDPVELATSGASNVSALFNNKTGSAANGFRATCIKSLTTIATLHDGSPLHSVLGGDMTGIIKDLISAFAGAATVGGQFFNTTSGNAVYDFDVDRIPGMAVQLNENVVTWSNRLLGSSIFASTYQATAAYDLSPEFMLSFNQGGPTTYPGTYYFSASSGQTGSCGAVGGVCPIFWP
jgi:triacylglycerol lipase